MSPACILLFISRSLTRQASARSSVSLPPSPQKRRSRQCQGLLRWRWRSASGMVVNCACVDVVSRLLFFFLSVAGASPSAPDPLVGLTDVPFLTVGFRQGTPLRADIVGTEFSLTLNLPLCIVPRRVFEGRMVTSQRCVLNPLSNTHI